MQKSSYIKTRHDIASDMMDIARFAYVLCQATCSVLIVYFCWYVQAFGNLAIVVNGSFLIMCGCIGVIWYCDGTVHKNDIPYGVWSQLIMVGYCLLTGFLIAYDQVTLMDAVKHYLIYVVIMIGISVVTTHNQSYDWILTTIRIAALICCVHLLGWGYHYRGGSRIVLSSNSNPNLLGTILNVGLFCILLRTEVSFKSLAINIPQVCLVLYNIVMTGSRKSLIAATMIMVFWGLSSFVHTIKKGNKKQKILICCVLICAAVAAWYFFITFVSHTAVMDRMQTMDNEESNGERIKMYHEAVEIMLDNPVFGCGLNQFAFLSGRGGYSHSTYAEAISNFGFVGSVLYFFPFLVTFARAVQMAFFADKTFICRFTLGFCIVEFFLAVGQIWFYDMAHFLAWTIIFLIIQNKINVCEANSLLVDGRSSKYVRH